MSPTFRALVFEIDDGIATVRFDRDKDTNAFSREMTLELLEVCRLVTADASLHQPRISALMLTGGTGRSFSVGGDFNDVSKLDEEGAIRAYLAEIVDLYVAILNVDIPVVAAIDRYAIGQGLQVALMADWRIGAHSCLLQMPELKNGVACPLGSIILEVLFGRARMQELVFGCELIDAAASRAHGLLSQLAPAEELPAAGLAIARKLMAYPRTSFVATKRIQNQRLIAALDSVREASAQAHVAAFLQRTGKRHFDKILGQG